MDCHNIERKIIKTSEDTLKILLMGNPNVGKSVIFSKLTGLDVLTANYTGTTVSFTQGKINSKEFNGILTDVPGTYSLEATSEAEEVAISMLKSGGDVVICVLDATNLERNLNFALQLREYSYPIIFALNLLDVAERQGITINIEELEKELGASVVPTVAIRNIGLKKLLHKVKEISDSKVITAPISMSQDERWQEVGRIVSKVQRVEHRHPTFWERMGDITIYPLTGIPIAFIVLAMALGLVVGGGKALRGGILLPLIHGLIIPQIRNYVSLFVAEGLLYNILVGEYGVLVKGIEWPFALILPYVLLFYIVLSLLEDTGFLPRIGVLVDGTLRRVGIQGSNIVPFIMGYGCAVPAILGSRALTSKKERLIVTGLVSLAVPCAAQTGAFIALLGDRSVVALLSVYIISLIAIVIGGVILNKIIPGKIDPMLLEIPLLLKPNMGALLKKIWIRTKHFLMEAEIPMILGIGIAALVAETGILNTFGRYIEPLVTGWLGLPSEATIGLLLGVIRRELAVLPLLELNLTTLQLVVGSVVALFYLPCLSVFSVTIKEYGLKTASIIGFSTLFTAFFIAGLINHVSRLIL
jgi:ferrous iron transport protein B